MINLGQNFWKGIGKSWTKFLEQELVNLGQKFWNRNWLTFWKRILLLLEQNSGEGIGYSMSNILEKESVALDLKRN